VGWVVMAEQVRFEPPGHDKAGWWGDPTSSIDWCERNYQHSEYIAEFFNTISNIAMVLSGTYGMYQAVKYGFELRFIVLGAGVAVVGIGSAAFHATLQYWAQMWDEVPMVWTMLIWLYIHFMMERKGSWTVALLLTLYGLLWAGIHTWGAFTVGFQVHFGLLVVWGIWLMHKATSTYCALPLLPYTAEEPAGVHPAWHSLRRVARCYVIYITAAFVLWIIDQQMCPTLHSLPAGLPNPQLHAVWHVLAGFNTHFGLQFVMALRQSVRDEALPATSWRFKNPDSRLLCPQFSTPPAS